MWPRWQVKDRNPCSQTVTEGKGSSPGDNVVWEGRGRIERDSEGGKPQAHSQKPKPHRSQVLTVSL